MKSPTRSRACRAATALGLAAALALPGTLPAGAAAPAPALAPAVAAAAAAAPIDFHSPGNPILGDGSFYSADAAPLVDGNTLYIYTGHDEATAQQGGFNMHDYAVFATTDVAAGDWSITKNAMDPDVTFDWATGNNAYAGQVFKAANGKFYWFAPVEWENTTVANRMAIGVAVSDTPTGPWADAVGAPLITWADVFGTSTNGQEVIDPHVFQDSDGKIYLYWGSWSVSRMVELTADLTDTVGTIKTMSGLNGFYEAPWVFKKNNIYYMAYDWKQGGSACTPSNYQACIAYATATNPAGPWTYQGIILGGTSATTVHPSLIEFKGQWYITYHTKDAVGGGHFRRSVAIDKVEWSGDTILPVKQTLANDPAFALTKNVAPTAQVSASFTEQPPMRVGALNDGRALTALLPPDQWGNYRGTTSSNESDWVSYQWQAPVRVNGAGIQFHQDSNWIRPPASWMIQYLDSAGNWQPVVNATYPTGVNAWQNVTFDAVTTTALRATFKGAPEGAYYHSVSVSEWEVYAVDPTGYSPVAVATKPAVAPALPEAVRLNYASGPAVWAPVNWKPVAASAYAAAGTFTVQGRAVGYSQAFVTATVTVSPTATTPDVPDTTAPAVSLAFAGSQGKDGWYSSAVTARVSADDDTVYRTDISARVGTGAWTTTPAVRFVDVPVTAQGSTVVSGKAVDAKGNTSAEVTRTVKIDTALPVGSAVVDPDTRATTITASDALSGLDLVQYRFDGTGSWQTYTAGASIAAPDGLPHQLVYRVVDLAGNQLTKTADIPLDDTGVLTGNVAKYGTPTTTFASSWAPIGGINDGTAGPLENAAAKLGSDWGTWPQVGEQRPQLTWSFDVTVDSIGAWWASDAADADNAGLIPPRTWVLQYLEADGVTWREVTPTNGSSYGRARDTFNVVTFEPVTTRSLRIVAQSWGAAEGGGSVGMREFQVIAATGGEPVDSTAPSLTVAATPDAASGENDWYTGPITLAAAAVDETDPAPVVEANVDEAGWAAVSGPITVTGDGGHSVLVRARDAAGNVSDDYSWEGRIDATAPVSKAVWSAADRSVTLRAADNTSSATGLQYALGSGDWTDYTAAVVVGEDAVLLKYRSVDEAGNVEADNLLEIPAKGVVLLSSSTVAVLSTATISTGAQAKVSIAVSGAGPVKPTGTVRVLEGAVQIAAGTLVNGRVVLSTPKSLLPGSHPLSVQYVGDDVYRPSMDSVTLKVTKAASNTTVTAPTTVVHGTSTVVKVVVKGANGQPGTGTMTLKVDGRKVVTGTLSAGKASLTLGDKTGLATGRRLLSVVYGGDASLTGSAGTDSVTVTKARSSVKATVSPEAVTSSVRAKATVRVTVSPSSVIATGAVSMSVTRGSVTATVKGTLKNGAVTVTLPKLAKGSYTVVTRYAGTGNISGSSATSSLKVLK